jgi:hypothetical protein
MSTSVVLLIVLIIFGCFALVVFFGAPYVPTLKAQQATALDLLNLKAGQSLLELGSGDGRFLRAAAKRGIKATGYELNPILYLISLVVTHKYRHLIKVRWGDYWLIKWPPTEAIYVFLTRNYMAKLNKIIIQSGRRNIKLVSYAAPIPGRQADKRQGPMFLYEY